MKKLSLISSLLTGVFLTAALSADEITDAVDEGMSYYAEGNYAEAVGSLNLAVQLLNQKASEKLGEYFPEAPDGWEKGEPEYESAAMAMFGGGNTASVIYTNGEQEIKMTIAANSPTIQSLLMLVNNPAFLSASGQKMEKIGGQKAMIEWDQSSGSVNVVVANSTLITFDGYNTTLDTVKELAGTVAYKQIALDLMQ